MGGLCTGKGCGFMRVLIVGRREARGWMWRVAGGGSGSGGGGGGGGGGGREGSVVEQKVCQCGCGWKKWVEVEEKRMGIYVEMVMAVDNSSNVSEDAPTNQPTKLVCFAGQTTMPEKVAQRRESYRQKSRATATTKRFRRRGMLREMRSVKSIRMRAQLCRTARPPKSNAGRRRKNTAEHAQR